MEAFPGQALCDCLCFLLRQGHAQVYEYGWGWFLNCLEATQEQAALQRRRRLADAALALRGEPRALERHMRSIS